METNPKHFYMAAAMLTYARVDVLAGKDEIGEERHKTQQRHMNIVLEQPRKSVSAGTLNNARIALQQRLADEIGGSFRGVRDIVFLSFSYLGHMKPADFHDMADDQAEPTKH
jgi:hypothetical protein